MRLKLSFLGLTRPPRSRKSRVPRTGAATSVVFVAKRESRPLVDRETTIFLSGCQNHRCAYCKLVVSLNGFESIVERDIEGVPLDLATLEHVEARSRGGDDHEDNYVMACRKCNTMRDDYPDAYQFEELVAMLLRQPGVRENWHYEPL